LAEYWNLAREKLRPRLVFLTVTAVSGQKQLLGFRASQVNETRQGVAEEAEAPKRWDLRLPSLRRRSALVPPLGKAARLERAEEREQQRQVESVEAARKAFFESPAGRARLAYKRGHRLFQYELAVNELEPTVVPGQVGTPATVTTDPVDILNSVTVEGWKLVTGKFFHSEMRNGVVGCYLFKRSQKRRLAMNNPWQDPTLSQ
jgi:hypothetical protein